MMKENYHGDNLLTEENYKFVSIVLLLQNTTHHSMHSMDMGHTVSFEEDVKRLWRRYP